mmetsp:Transcript_19055/g.41415  ORF Transcript_19055/g.41415 Transcript_19055/m.41415 type:complete len:89 (-) Transcript_19055:91-357(-)
MVYTRPVHTAEEIRRWKDLIYGQTPCYQVGEWVSNDQSPAPTRRRVLPERVSSRSRTPTPSSMQDDWLTSSPGSSKKRNYRVKGGGLR